MSRGGTRRQNISLQFGPKKNIRNVFLPPTLVVGVRTIHILIGRVETEALVEAPSFPFPCSVWIRGKLSDDRRADADAQTVTTPPPTQDSPMNLDCERKLNSTTERERDSNLRTFVSSSDSSWLRDGHEVTRKQQQGERDV